MAKKLLENNFHVICEKPLTTTYKEALDLKKIQSEKKLVFKIMQLFITHFKKIQLQIF